MIITSKRIDDRTKRSSKKHKSNDGEFSVPAYQTQGEWLTLSFLMDGRKFSIRLSRFEAQQLIRDLEKVPGIRAER